MAVREMPEWVAKRKKGNVIIALVLLALVVFYVVMFVAKFVSR